MRLFFVYKKIIKDTRNKDTNNIQISINNFQNVCNLEFEY